MQKAGAEGFQAMVSDCAWVTGSQAITRLSQMAARVALSANVSETPIPVGITEQGDGVERHVAEVGRSFKPSS